MMSARISSEIILSTLLVFLPLLTSCDEPVPPHVVEAQRVRWALGKWASEKYGVRVAMSGGSMMHEVSRISLGFAYEGVGTVELGRCMLVPIIEKFLQMINEDEALRPHLSHHPFTIEDIGVKVGFTDDRGYIRDVPSLAFATQVGDTIYYKREEDPNARFKIVHAETFEEAQKIVHENGCEGLQ